MVPVGGESKLRSFAPKKRWKKEGMVHTCTANWPLSAFGALVDCDYHFKGLLVNRKRLPSTFCSMVRSRSLYNGVWRPSLHPNPKSHFGLVRALLPPPVLDTSSACRLTTNSLGWQSEVRWQPTASHSLALFVLCFGASPVLVDAPLAERVHASEQLQPNAAGGQQEEGGGR
jgi:hypothetical protein